MVDLIEKNIKSSLEKKEYEKFNAFFCQYSSHKNKNESNYIYYKNIALIYYLSLENFEDFYVLLQSCKNPEECEYVLNIYDCINTMNIEELEKIHLKSDSAFKELINNILNKLKSNLKKLIQENNENNNLQKSYDNEHEKNIEDLIHVIKNFNE